MPATLRCMVTLELLDKKLQQAGVFELKNGREYIVQFIPVLPGPLDDATFG